MLAADFSLRKSFDLPVEMWLPQLGKEMKEK
jgi:hypothetical protein